MSHWRELLYLGNLLAGDMPIAKISAGCQIVSCDEAEPVHCASAHALPHAQKAARHCDSLRAAHAGRLSADRADDEPHAVGILDQRLAVPPRQCTADLLSLLGPSLYPWVPLRTLLHGEKGY